MAKPNHLNQLIFSETSAWPARMKFGMQPVRVEKPPMLEAYAMLSMMPSAMRCTSVTTSSSSSSLVSPSLEEARSSRSCSSAAFIRLVANGATMRATAMVLQNMDMTKLMSMNMAIRTGGWTTPTFRRAKRATRRGRKTSSRAMSMKNIATTSIWIQFQYEWPMIAALVMPASGSATTGMRAVMGSGATSKTQKQPTRVVMPSMSFAIGYSWMGSTKWKRNTKKMPRMKPMSCCVFQRPPQKGRAEDVSYVIGMVAAW
mmetsp:Transcript_39314/g.103882  ORF Transcript_39314/g.103882 Transcript_39314/m.103882 type:complete len:258 (+) Transcript_39314:830-1603(+)